MSDEEGDVLSVMLQDDGKEKSQSSASSSSPRKYGYGCAPEFFGFTVISLQH